LKEYEGERGAVGAVTEFKAATELRVLYENLYKKRYGTMPFIEETDAGAFGFLASKFKGAEGKKLIEAYFQIQDKFIQENCHPIGFIRKSINKLLPVMAKSRPRTEGGIRVTVSLSCDACTKLYNWIGDPRALPNTRRCAECISSNKQAQAFFATRKKLELPEMIKSMSAPPNPEAEDPESIEPPPIINSLPSVSGDSD
jgi:hypothetical protein